MKWKKNFCGIFQVFRSLCGPNFVKILEFKNSSRTKTKEQLFFKSISSNEKPQNNSRDSKTSGHHKLWNQIFQSQKHEKKKENWRFGGKWQSPPTGNVWLDFSFHLCKMDGLRAFDHLNWFHFLRNNEAIITDTWYVPKDYSPSIQDCPCCKIFLKNSKYQTPSFIFPAKINKSPLSEEGSTDHVGWARKTKPDGKWVEGGFW